MTIPHPELPLLEASKSVFINCPYDSEYEPLFDAIIFTVICCGFIPRSAKESGKVCISRLERILHALYTSDYSIHDLSRCQGEGEQLLARFNMPLELGLAMSRKFTGNSNHDWLVLVPENAPYAHFVSDLAGYDLKRYQGDTDALVRSVLPWLLNIPDVIPWTTPLPIIAGLQDFAEKKRDLKKAWGNDIRWNLLLDAAKDCVPEYS